MAAPRPYPDSGKEGTPSLERSLAECILAYTCDIEFMLLVLDSVLLRNGSAHVGRVFGLAE